MLIDIVVLFSFISLIWCSIDFIWFVSITSRKYTSEIPKSYITSVKCVKNYYSDGVRFYYVSGKIYNCQYWITKHETFKSYILNKNTQNYIIYNMDTNDIVPLLGKKIFNEYFIDIQNERDNKIKKLLK